MQLCVSVSVLKLNHTES